jgi:hypothetical protein
MIGPSQRSLPDNTHHSQEKNIQARGGIRTHNRGRRAAADPRLRPRGHWDRPFCFMFVHIKSVSVKYQIRGTAICKILCTEKINNATISFENITKANQMSNFFSCNIVHFPDKGITNAMFNTNLLHKAFSS